MPSERVFLGSILTDIPGCVAGRMRGHGLHDSESGGAGGCEETRDATSAAAVAMTEVSACACELPSPLFPPPHDRAASAYECMYRALCAGAGRVTVHGVDGRGIPRAGTRMLPDEAGL